MKVEFTEHALERAEQRLPRLGLPAIVREIEDAITAGRVSDDPPTWRIRNHGGQEHGREVEFAWSPDGARIYVLSKPTTPSYAVLVSILLASKVAA